MFNLSLPIIKRYYRLIQRRIHALGHYYGEQVVVVQVHTLKTHLFRFVLLFKLKIYINYTKTTILLETIQYFIPDTAHYKGCLKLIIFLVQVKHKQASDIVKM